MARRPRPPRRRADPAERSTSTRWSPTTSGPPGTFAAGPRKSSPIGSSPTSGSGSPRPGCRLSSGLGTRIVAAVRCSGAAGVRPRLRPAAHLVPPPPHRRHRRLQATHQRPLRACTPPAGATPSARTALPAAPRAWHHRSHRCGRGRRGHHRHPSDAKQWSYRERRKEMLLALLDEHADSFDEPSTRWKIVDHLRQARPPRLLAEHTGDDDFTYRSRLESTSDGATPAFGEAGEDDMTPRGTDR